MGYLPKFSTGTRLVKSNNPTILGVEGGGGFAISRNENCCDLYSKQPTTLLAKILSFAYKTRHVNLTVLINLSNQITLLSDNNLLWHTTYLFIIKKLNFGPNSVIKNFEL